MSFTKQTIRDIDLQGKSVLLRADYNVPLSVDGAITSDYRIRQSVPTIKYLLEHGAKRIAILSHLGRPEPGTPDPHLSLQPVAAVLTDLLGEPVEFVSDCLASPAWKGRIALHENLRICPEEEANDDAFAAKLARGHDLFVQDGFGVVHRAHASTEAVTAHLPSIAGLLLEKEVATLTEALEHPQSPFIAILGGAKVSDKIELIERFIDIADRIIIGGALANAFLQHFDYPIGKSKVETDQEATVQRVIDKAQAKIGAGRPLEDFLWLPTHGVAVASEVTSDAKRRDIPSADISENDYILDIQIPSSLLDEIRAARTIIWNGPVGMTEFAEFSQGSRQLAEAISQSDATSIIGGGDTAAFIESWDEPGSGKFTHISTGGGASLELMAGKVLPGVAALLDK
jgi:3-phosphoglycerate kinase